MGSASAENFRLRWNDFAANVSSSFRQLRDDRDFFDVSLTCEDLPGKVLRAHRVVLSACSEHFRRLLHNAAAATTNSNSNLLIYLRGVRVRDLEAVLDFMYHGEVNVSQEDLSSFLAVAEDLQVKGLTQEQQQGGLAEDAKQSPVKRSRKSSTPQQQANSSSSDGAKRLKKENQDGDEVQIVEDPSPAALPKIEHDDYGSSSSATGIVKSLVDKQGDRDEGGDEVVYDGGASSRPAFEEQYDEEGYDDFEPPGDNIGTINSSAPDKDYRTTHAILQSDGSGRCAFCNKTFKTLYGAKCHIENYHSPTVRVQCTLCNNLFPNKQHFRVHINSTHKIFGVKDIVATYGRSFTPSNNP